MVRAIDIISEDRKKVVQNIIERIEKEGLEWKKGWSPEMVAPTNPSSKAEYKGRNVIKAFNSPLNNEYKDPRWVTFKQADKEGWKVKKGAKSIVLEKWIFDKEEKKLNPETGKEEKIKVKLDRPVPNYFRVFNGQDIEGMPPLNIKPLDKSKTLEIAENIIKSSKVPVVEIAQPRAYHSSSENRIVMPLKDTFKSQESYLATALHEMVHSTGKELGRDLSGKFGEEKYAKEELVAELGSLMLQGKLGIKLEDRQVDNHAAYLQSWVKVLKNDSNELFRAAEKAEKASELLYERYQEYVKEHNLDLKKGNTAEISQEQEANLSQNKEFWRIEFNEYPENGKNYKGQVLTEELLDEIKELDNKVYTSNKIKRLENDWENEIEEQGSYKFYLEKVENGEVTKNIRLDIGDGNYINGIEYANLYEELYNLNERNRLEQLKENLEEKGQFLKVDFVESEVPNREKYLNKIVTKEFLKEIEELDKTLPKINSINQHISIGRNDSRYTNNYTPGKFSLALGTNDEKTKETFKKIHEELNIMENIKNIKNNETFKYYSTERELNVGNYPKENLVEVARFSDKLNVKYTKNQAYGYVKYSSPLTGQQRGDFKLISEKEISKIKIAGYEFKNYQEVSKAISEEKYIVSTDRIVEPYFDDKTKIFKGKTIFKKERGPGDIPITKRGEEFLSADKEFMNRICDTKVFDIKDKEQEIKTSEKIKNSIKESPYITTSEIAKKYNLDEKEIKEELSTLIKNKEVFYHKENDKNKLFIDKKEFVESLEANKKEKETAKRENEERIKNVMKKIVNEPIPRGNYNALTGNEIITADHSSGDKRWLTKDDVRKHGISVKENEQSVVTIMTHKEEEKLYVKPVEYYNVEQLHITKEVEKQFKPMKEKVIDKSKEKGQGIGD